MDELLAFVPEDKRAQFAEAAKSSGYVKLSDDVALNHVLNSQSLRDKVATPVAETALKNFQERKLPELIKAERDKLIKELNPEETPDQKRIRELEERVAAADRREAAESARAKMREIGKAKGVDVTLAEKLYSMPEDEANQIFEEFEKLAREKADLETRLNYGSRPPQGGNGSPKLLETLQAEYNSLMAAGKRQEANAVFIKMSRLPKQ